jgi:hypothetical protein
MLESIRVNRVFIRQKPNLRQVRSESLHDREFVRWRLLEEYATVHNCNEQFLRLLGDNE